jgi:hypothetical protein
MKLFVTASMLLALVMNVAGVSAGENTADKLPTVDEVLQRYVEAVGGQYAIEKLTTRECRGILTTDLPTRTPPVHRVRQVTAYAKVPGSVLLIQQDSSSCEKVGFDGSVRWRQDGSGVKEDKDLSTQKIHWLLNPQGALRINEYFPELTVAGIQQTQEGKFVVLESAKLDKAYYSLRFSMKTGLLKQIGFYWYLEDYREADGVLIPFRVVMSRKGGTSTYEFSEVKHNVEIDDSLFTMPVVEEN